MFPRKAGRRRGGGGEATGGENEGEGPPNKPLQKNLFKPRFKQLKRVSKERFEDVSKRGLEGVLNVGFELGFEKEVGKKEEVWKKSCANTGTP